MDGIDASGKMTGNHDFYGSPIKSRSWWIKVSESAD
jgi:hypothetical protein